MSVEDIEHLIETGKEQGVLKATEHEVAMKCYSFAIAGADIMRARVDIDAVDHETPPEEVVGVMAMSGFSRLPVYERDLDHVIGFLYNKDVLQQFYSREAIELRKMLRYRPVRAGDAHARSAAGDDAGEANPTGGGAR